MATDDIKSPRLGKPTGKEIQNYLNRKKNKPSGPLVGGEDATWLGNIAGGVISGAGSTAGSMLEGVDRFIAGTAGVEYRPEIASPIGKLGQAIEKGAKSLGDIDPARAEDVSTKLAQGTGSTIPYLVGGALTGAARLAAPALMGAMGTATEQARDYERAVKEQGLEVNQEDQAAATFAGAVPGLLESVPIARMFGRLDKLTAGNLGALVKNTAKGTAEEALQEGLQQTAQNLIASNVVKYDPDREMFFDTPEAAGIGGGVGFMLNATFNAMGLRKAGKFETAAKNAYTDVAQKDRTERDQELKDLGGRNPVTQEQIGTPDIAKANTQILRLERFIEQNPERAEGMQRRIDAIKKQLTEKYIKPPKGPDGKAVTVDEVAKQEAQDVIERMRAEEIVPEEITIPGIVAEAEPFPKKKGIRAGEIKNKKDVDKILKKYFTPEEITIDQVPQEEPAPIDAIDLQETEAAIEEITLDSVPAEPTFFEDKPRNTALADELGRIEQQRKRRDETNAAFEARKQAEIAEAYRQRELQISETQAEEVQTPAPEPTPARQEKQAEETVPATEDKAGLKETIKELQDLTRRQAYPGPASDLEGVETSEPFARQAGFGDVLPPAVQAEMKDGLPGFLERQPNEAIPAKNGKPDNYVPDTEPVKETSPLQETGYEYAIKNSEYGADLAAANLSEKQKKELDIVLENAGLDYEKNPQNWENEQAALDAYVGGWLGEQNVSTKEAPKASTPRPTQLFHTLRNISDLDGVLNEGLKAGSNVGDATSQAIGNGGLTLEYAPEDLEIDAKDYRGNEATVSKQKKAKPVRAFIDISDVPGLKEGTGGYAEFEQHANELESLVEAGVDTDEMMTDIGGYLFELENGKYSARAAELKKIEEKYGRDVAEYLKENAEAMNAAMNAPEGEAGYTVEEYVKELTDKLPADLAVFTYEVDDNGSPINFQEVRAAAKPKEEVKVQRIPPAKPELKKTIENGLIGKGKNKTEPFANEKSAKAARTRLGLGDESEIVAVDGGFAIRPSKDGLDQRNAIEKQKATKQTDPARVFKNGEVATDTDLVVEDAPEPQTIDQEVVDYVLTLSEQMKNDPRPERYAGEIKEAFGSVKAFMSLRSAILSGEVIGGDPNAVIATPVGEVENTAVTQPDPPAPMEAEAPLKESKVFAAEVSQLEEELAAIDEQIIQLEESMDYAENPDKIIKKLENLQIKRENLENKKRKTVSKETKAVKAEEKLTQEFTKDEIDEMVKLDQDSVDFSGYDEDFSAGDQDSTGATQADVNVAQTAVDKFYRSLDDRFKETVDIVVVSRKEDIPADYKSVAALYLSGTKDMKNYGMIYRNLNPKRNKKRNLVVIFAKPGATFHHYEATIFHEVVGHYGLRQLWGKQWVTEMQKLLKNKVIAARAYAMRTRWKNIDLTPASGTDTMWVHDMFEYHPTVKLHQHQKYMPHKGKPRPQVRVSKEGMQKLMDEYIAEVAAGLAGHKNFQPIDKLEQGIIARMMKAIRHLLRKSGFGDYSSKVADDHLIQLMQASYTNLTRAPVYQEGKLTNEAMEANASIEAVIKEGVATGLWSEKDARAVIRSIDAREGRTDNSKWQRNIDNLSDRIRRSWLGKHFSSTGWLPHASKLNATENEAKGAMEKATRDARVWYMATKDLVDAEKQAIFQFFGTKNADPNMIINPKIRKMAVNAKANIEALGEQLVQLGMLSRKTYEANKGSYLPIRYWKYLETYYATGKQMSFRNYLKAREDLSAEEKQALGQVQDPSFLVAETIAVLGRDVALQTMFKNMTTMNRVGNLGWFIETPRWITVSGRKMSMADVESNIDRLNEQLAMGQGVNPLYINERGVEEIQRQIAELEEAKRSAEVQAFNEGIDNAIRAAVGEDVEITEDMRKLYRGQFKQFKDKRLGHLNYKWARKEIYEEITEGNQMYNREAVDFMSKHFGPGGSADLANQYWKAGKVVLNPPSWIRNGIGNWILLDIGTNTNNATLFKYGVEELQAWASGRTSKYMQWAHDYGLFNTTYSAAELSNIQRQAVDAFKGEAINVKDIKNPMKKMWWMFHGKFHQTLEIATTIYGGTEGYFKTIALKDHILTWEKMTGKKIDNVSEDERVAVIRAGVEVANKNIFDYSKVPGWMRTMRRMPFIGAPFLTYTFKAIPQSIESLARRPQKFIKYAMFPTVMANLFLSMNDLDDDDMDEIQRKMPNWIKEKSSVFILPMKDANGKWQAMDFGYYLPWAPLHNMMLMATKTFDPNNAAMSTLQVGGNALYDLGFLGGPMPQLISGFLSNKDPFTGREIIRTAGTSGDKANDMMTYMLDLWMPPFITSKGVLGRTLDNMGLEPSPFNSGREFSSMGIDRETAMQTALRGVGMNVYGIDEREAAAQQLKRHQAEMKKLKMARTQIVKDRNLSPEQKAGKLREMNEQIKLLNEKRREEVSGER